ncbi:PadR family transcriptional regulator [Spirosoma sp. HMF4905]|uniref:PadR family transcriptional regulator n=1 Tax=Spirosoma arboris TaxID=2682092 RepID=A0A7K1SJ37_9BACT|nr:PadR family transcriptional regulator [Spirosoma arboris]MVM33812.1 PadR family transcriptional regulator [Spirosoma arboris]
MKRPFLGELEEIVLLTVAALQKSAYCASITQTIDQQMARSISFPTVHTTLQRLEEKGFVSSLMGGATTERGGRQKRLFTVTVAGQQALIECRHLRTYLWEQIPTPVLQLWGA